jgi:membrane protease YdiL (CAAX protease family)
MSEDTPNTTQPIEIDRRDAILKSLLGTISIVAGVRIALTPGSFLGIQEDTSFPLGSKDGSSWLVKDIDFSAIDQGRLQSDFEQFRRYNTVTDYLQTSLIGIANGIVFFGIERYANDILLKDSPRMIGRHGQTKEGLDIGVDTKAKIAMDAVAALFASTIALPLNIGEEAIFRKAVLEIFRGDISQNSIGWNIGIPSAVLFALVHNIEFDFQKIKEEGLLEGARDMFFNLFSLDEIPLPQFIGGLVYWYVFREKGIVHSTLAHSVTNATGSYVNLIHQIQKRGRMRSANIHNAQQGTNNHSAE